MKAIYVYDEVESLSDGMPCRRTRLYADSALGRDVMPLFLPDLPVPLTAGVCLAFRVSRLGKHISEKFAMRYFDAVGAVCVLYADGNTADATVLAWTGATRLFDGMVTTGKWLPFDPEVPISLDCPGGKLVVTPAKIGLAAALSQISALATVKSGDLLIMDNTYIPVALERDTRIQASVNSQECLSVKVK